MIAVAVGLLAVVPVLVLGLPHGRTVFRWLYYLPAYRLGEFVIGICLAVLMQRGWRARATLWQANAGVLLALGVVIALGVVVQHVPSVPGHTRGLPEVAADLVMLPAFALWIVTLAAADLSGRRSVYATRPFVLLGTWSYALYLTHQEVVRVAAQALRRHLPAGLPGNLALEGLALAVVVAVAAAVYTVLERPAERWLRRTLIPAGHEPAQVVS